MTDVAKKFYYIAKTDEERFGTGVFVSREEAYHLYQTLLTEKDTPVEERNADAKRRLKSGKPATMESHGLSIHGEYLSDQEYFQKRLQGYITHEESMKRNKDG